MKKWWIGGFFILASLVTVGIFFQVSFRMREVYRDMGVFFKLLEKKQYETLYTQWTTEPYRKQHAMVRFVRDLEPIAGPHTLKIREMFVSFRRVTLRGEILVPSGRSFAMEFHVRKQRHYQVYAFRLQESVEGIASAFLTFLQKQQWQQAYTLTSSSFRKQVSLVQLEPWFRKHGIARWQSYAWSMVDNYSKIGKVSGIWRSKQGDAGGVSISLFREQNRWQVGHVHVQ